MVLHSKYLGLVVSDMARKCVYETLSPNRLLVDKVGVHF